MTSMTYHDGELAGTGPALLDPRAQPGTADRFAPDRPGACSIDMLALVHVLKFGRGAQPRDPHSIWDAAALGLIDTSPFQVTPRGEKALAEHNLLYATDGEETLAWAEHRRLAA
jgi:hypothetical protein